MYVLIWGAAKIGQVLKTSLASPVINIDARSNFHRVSQRVFSNCNRLQTVSYLVFVSRDSVLHSSLWEGKGVAQNFI
jgi:hypothetical protein